MYPSLSTRRRILLTLLVLGGKSTYSVIQSFLPPGYSGPKFYGMLKRLEKEGLVKRQIAIHRSPFTAHYIRLLPAGLELLERRFGPRIRRLADKDYKGYKDYNHYDWSLIILNFPTDQAYSRSRLAGRLTELGCGLLRDGVYVSPYPILPSVAEWAEENHCLENVSLLNVIHQTPDTRHQLLPWDLPGLSRRYLSLLDRLNIAKGISLPPKQKRALARIKSDFLGLLIRDPLLPKTLLPPDYPLARVIGEITGLDKDKSFDKTNIDKFTDKKIAKTGPENQSRQPKNS